MSDTAGPAIDMSLTFGSLFSGIGGIDLGLERAGMVCKWQIEIDDFRRKVLEKHWPDVPKWGDVKDVKGCELPTVDLIAGGFPCQSVSVAGKQRGDEDERWLWDEFARLIGEIRPRWVLIENVPGLRSIDNGRLFRKVLWDLAQSGYDAEWDHIPAATFGAPHLRYRLFVVAHLAERGLQDQNRQGQRDREWSENVFGRVFQFGTSADFDDKRQLQPERAIFYERRWFDNGNEEARYISHVNAKGLERSGGQHGLREDKATEPASWLRWWDIEPPLDRVVYGFSSRLDRRRHRLQIEAQGDAVVPQVAEWIGLRIVECERRIQQGRRCPL